MKSDANLPDGASRRDLLKAAAASSLAFGSHRPPIRSESPIAAENRKPGTREWINTKVEVDPETKYRSRRIEGYVSHTSILPGESLDFFVSTNPGVRFEIRLYRLGYYQGLGGRLVHSMGPFQGAPQPEPPIGPKRLRECEWQSCARLRIPDDWLSGVYVGQLTAGDEGWQSYVIFVVRDERAADFVFQCSDHTWSAYNRWPSQFALYDDGEKPWYWGPDVAVSFDRPFGKYCQIFDAPLSVGSGEFLLWEYPLAFWMEQNGYDVTYIANGDTHARPETLRRTKAFLSVGHDEYWSLAMYRNVKQAIDAGVNVAFLSGNAVCGVVDVQPSARGSAYRVIERVGLFGGVDDTAEGFPDMRRLTQHGPSEGLLIGARNAYPLTGGGDWICRLPEHWLFAGTGMKAGDSIPGLVGWEWHGDPTPLAGLEVVASGPTSNGSKDKGEYAATLYPGPKGNLVFNASTIWWGDGLSEPPGYIRPAVYTKPLGPDARVQRITRNLFDRFLSH